METFTLSQKEMELMELFWEAGVPLARAEILERAAQRPSHWKPNSIHILVNSLLDKKAVQVSGFYLNARKLGRTFEPALTQEEYAVMQVVRAVQIGKKVLGKEPKWAPAVLKAAGIPVTSDLSNILDFPGAISSSDDEEETPKRAPATTGTKKAAAGKAAGAQKAGSTTKKPAAPKTSAAEKATGKTPKKGR